MDAMQIDLAMRAAFDRVSIRAAIKRMYELGRIRLADKRWELR